MKKAVFIDYMGTLMRYEGSDLKELIDCFAENSILKNAQEVDSWWSNERIRQEEMYSGDDFRNEDEICMNILEKAERETAPPDSTRPKARGKNHGVCAKRQAVWLAAQSVSN